ncbi:MAG: MBL fold metallo-hydrolase [Eubacterium sp.]
MKITVLTENSRPQGSELVNEHGLSLFIEYGEKNYLVDTGSSDAFLHNAQALGVDIAKTDICILSHGHYDHAGGLPAFLQKNESAPVYMMDTAPEGHYLQQKDGTQKYIGIPEGLASEQSRRIRMVNRVCSIADGVYLVPHTTPGLEKIGEKADMYKKQGEEYVPDDFSHEMSIVFDADPGLVIVSSCSHAGMDHIINEVDENFHHAPICAFIGGLHMMGMHGDAEICTVPEQKIQRLAFFLKDHGIQRVWTGHCTGEIGFRLLAKYMDPDQVQKLTTGKTFSIPSK